MGRWTADEIRMLRDAYSSEIAEDIDLPGLAARLGRNKANVCRKAREHGLTNQRRRMIANPKGPPKRKYETLPELRAAQSASRKEWIAKNGHPRGMLGKKQTPETIAITTAASRRGWAAMTPAKLAVRTMRQAKTRAINMAEGKYVNDRKGCTWKAGWREIGRHRKYFRSRWEANYAHYLQFLLERGEILDWEHEPETFWFVGIKRGACSYLPDFRVTDGGGVAYHEVKGWMDARSKTKIRRMKKYHPKVKLVLVQEKQYMEINRKLAALIPGWEADPRRGR